MPATPTRRAGRGENLNVDNSAALCGPLRSPRLIFSICIADIFSVKFKSIRIETNVTAVRRHFTQYTVVKMLNH